MSPKELGGPQDRSDIAKSQEIKKNDFPYRLKKEGSMSFILDSKGNKVSNGYHEFVVLKQRINESEAKVLIGKTGASSVMLKFPKHEGDFFQEMGDEFHGVEIDESLMLLVSTKGAMKYIVDPLTGSIVSEGYHEYFWRDGKLYGQTGTHAEEVVPKKGASIKKIEGSSQKLLE